MTSRKSPERSPRAKKVGGGKREPFAHLFDGVDEDQLAMLQQLLQSALTQNTHSFPSGDVVDLFKGYLSACNRSDGAEYKSIEGLPELLGELSDLQISSNGGDPVARSQMNEILSLLEDAVTSQSLHLVDMVVTGKMLFEARWAVPEFLRVAIERELAKVDVSGSLGNEVDGFLYDFARSMHLSMDDVFFSFEQLSSLVAVLPRKRAAELVYSLATDTNPAIRHASIGFILNPDSAISESALGGLVDFSKSDPVSSLVIERLVRIRTWMSGPLVAKLDQAIRSMRLKALPPVKAEGAKIQKVCVSICDGTGTRSVFVTQKNGRRYQFVSAMLKLTGIAECLVIRDLSKAELAGIIRQFESGIILVEARLDLFQRMLSLSIADGLRTGNVPPYTFVDLQEALGLAPVQPDNASPMEIISELLSDQPDGEIGPEAVRLAHHEIMDFDFDDQWHEAGEALEKILLGVKGANRRVKKLLTDHLPARREFWTRQFAISALALHGDKKSVDSPWRTMALIGRDLGSGYPLETMPIMREVASLSVRAFEQRLALGAFSGGSARV